MIWIPDFLLTINKYGDSIGSKIWKSQIQILNVLDFSII